MAEAPPLQVERRECSTDQCRPTVRLLVMPRWTRRIRFDARIADTTVTSACDHLERNLFDAKILDLRSILTFVDLQRVNFTQHKIPGPKVPNLHPVWICLAKFSDR
jgi:hypothetical protein